MAEAEITTIARPYARAAFAYAQGENGGLDNWSTMLGTLAAVCATPLVREALDYPALAASGQAGLLLDICSEEMNDSGRNFVGLLAEYGRIEILPSISELFELFKSSYEETIEVEITSAFEVEDADKEQLSTALKTKLQRDVNLSTAVDRSLLGGVIIRTEATVIDNSVRGKLEKLAQQLA